MTLSMNTSKTLSMNTSKTYERRPRPVRRRTNLLRGNFHLFNEQDDLKLFSEPNGLKGVVFEKNKKVMDAFPRVKDIVVNEDGPISKLSDEVVSKSTFYDHHEGALIRVIYACNSWRVSTQKKIDAFSSRWSGSQTFGNTWAEAIKLEVQRKPEIFGESENYMMSLFNTLDKEKQYLFIIRHNEDNRIVCESPATPTVYHVGTFIKGVVDPNDDIKITKPVSYKFPTVDALKKHVLSLDSSQISGCLMRTEKMNWYKLQNEEYITLEKVRGNEPSLRFRYLQVRQDEEMVQNLYKLFPSHTQTFDECEDSIYAIAKYIHRAYMDRFIRRQFITLDREFFTIMRLCHDWHKQDRQHNKVDLDKVIYYLNTRYDHVLNKMIRMYKNIVEEQNKEQDDGEYN
jgi:hypothetical protein